MSIIAVTYLTQKVALEMFNTSLNHLVNPLSLEPEFPNKINPSLQNPEEEEEKDMVVKYM